MIYNPEGNVVLYSTMYHDAIECEDEIKQLNKLTEKFSSAGFRVIGLPTTDVIACTDPVDFGYE